MPLSKFEECLLTNNLSSLIISGFPEPKVLSFAWETIMQEYSDLMGNTEYNLYKNLWKEVELLKIDYASVGILIAALRKTYSKYFCEQLNEIMNLKCRFNVLDLPSYFAELDKCERRSKAMKIRLDLKTIEFEAVKNKVTGDKGKPIDKNYFTSILIILSKHNNYRITKDIFVNEYVEYLKQFNLYCEQMNKAVKK